MNGTVDVNGTIRSKNQAPQPYDRPSGKRFNNVVCMNVAFKRQAVNAVGGFDEYFNNYFEETDLCVRMIQSGFRVVHEPDAVVWHEFATGQNRKSRWEQNWYAISRNSTYMPFKDFKGNRYVLMSIKAFHYGKRMASVTIPFMKREISFMTMQNIYSEVTRGFADGLRDGMKTRRTMAARRQ
jgi:GT2 family glycosyltransferase